MKQASLEDVVNTSITETLTRSIYTSFTTFVMVAVLYVLGVATIKEFSLPLIVGVVARRLFFRLHHRCIVVSAEKAQCRESELREIRYATKE